MARNAMKKKEPQRINADAPFVFEPHNGWGSKHPIDGEVWPFGYISLDESIRTPVFELNTLFEQDARDLLSVALVCAAARELFGALNDLVKLIEDVAPAYSASPMVENARIAIEKASLPSPPA